MGFFGKRTSARFIPPDGFERLLQTQMALTPQTVAELGRHGVTNNSRLRLEYFFYTNTPEKAAVLVKSLVAREYTSESRLAADKSGNYVITGWTTRMPVDLASVVKWTEDMCRVGFDHDCEFDGWGTNPRQPEDWDPRGA